MLEDFHVFIDFYFVSMILMDSIFHFFFQSLSLVYRDYGLINNNRNYTLMIYIDAKTSVPISILVDCVWPKMALYNIIPILVASRFL